MSNLLIHTCYSEPLLTNEKQQLSRIWVPNFGNSNRNTEIKYLDLNLEPKMIQDPVVDRVNFWRKLRLANE